MAAARYLINGTWRSSGRVRSITNPYTGESVGESCQTPPDEITEACQVAARAFQATRKMAAYDRAAILEQVAQAISARKEECARLITSETGKPISLSRAEVERAVFTFQTSSEEAKRITGEVLPLDLAKGSEGRFALVHRFPLGVIAAITPFNFPLNLVAHKLGPAIAAGNTLVLKPSSNAPGIALLLGSIINETSLPKGALNIIVCPGSEARQLIENKHVKLISFTGSPAVGWKLRAAASKKRVSLELGGNAAVIVDEGADNTLAARRLAIGGFANAGQSCISVQRIFVHDSSFETFMKAFLSEVKSLKVGDPFDEQTMISAMIDEPAAAKVETWLGEALSGGAHVVLGGTRNRALFAPTIVTNVRPEMKIASQEVFAPLVVVDRFSRFEDAVEQVNRSEYGLQAALFSNNAAHIFYAYRELEVGGVVVNDASSFRMDHMPYGGVKDSGTGKEGVRYAIEEMTELKLLALNN